MPIIHISIKRKIATAECGAYIVCKNADYKLRFEFDEEWGAETEKKALFAFNGKLIKVDFSGVECDVPKLPNTTLCLVEVQEGNIRTAVPASIECYPCLDENLEVAPPSDENESGGGGGGVVPPENTVKLNLTNGEGEGSLQIVGGLAHGKGATSLSKSDNITLYKEYSKDNLSIGITVNKIVANKPPNFSSVDTFSGLDFEDENGNILPLRDDYGQALSWQGETITEYPKVIYSGKPLTVIYVQSNIYYENGEEKIYNLVDHGFVSLFKSQNLESGAYGDNSFVGGVGTIAQNEGETALGRYNARSERTLFSIGNGTPENPHNAFEIDEDGNAYDGTGHKLLNDTVEVGISEEEKAEIVRLAVEEINSNYLGNIGTALDEIIALQDYYTGATFDELHEYARGKVEGDA